MEMEDAADRISQLPESIIHHILSYLDSPKQLVRMSVLSKYWLTVTVSFPVSGFDIRQFEDDLKPSSRPVNRIKHNRYVRDCFFKYVEYTISRFYHQNVSVHTFKLIAPHRDQDPIQVDIVNRCLELFLKKGVKGLVIEIIPSSSDYRLPNTLLSASSLTSLKICGCELPSSLMVDDVKFTSLKMLELDRVPLNDEVIKRLTTSCPILEKITINYLEGVKKVCVYGLQNLQEVMIGFGDRILETIDIDAPNLWHLSLVDRGSGMPSMKVASCKKLTKLSYEGCHPSRTWGGLDLSSDFPFLEELYLELDDPQSLELSSHSLRTFMLCSDLELDGIDLSAPNLLLFIYNEVSPFVSGVKRDSILSKPCMEYGGFVDRYSFQYLRKFLDKNIGFKELKLRVWVDREDVEKLMGIQSSPYELEHVELSIKELSDYEAAVDVVLWCFRPLSLTLDASFACTNTEEWSHIVKFTHEKLLLQEDEGKTNIQIVLSSSSEAKKHFCDLHSFLTATPRDLRGETITFIKEEIVPVKKKRMIKQSKVL